MNHRSSRPTWARAALCATLPLLWLAVLSIAGPLHAQTNSPSGGQPTGTAPAQGGVSNDAGANAGGDGQSGNRTTPGGGGATGGGASGADSDDTADGGSAGPIIGVVAILAVIIVGATIATRHRRVMEDTGARTTT